MKRVCQAPGCEEKHRSNGYCEAHYARFRKGDVKEDVPLRKNATRAMTTTFIKNALATESDDCIIWPYGKDDDGYGVFSDRKTQITKAHIYVCTVAHGWRPSELHQVRHLCGNSSYVNHRHLAWGTPQDNSDDMKTHGTVLIGSNHPQAKLTETQVKEIRLRNAQGETRRALARAYGVSPYTINAIIQKETWKHV